MFVFAAGFFVVVVWLGVCFWGKGVFVLILHLHGKVLTSKIMIANSFKTEVTRIRTRTQKLGFYTRLYFAKLYLTVFLSKI